MNIYLRKILKHDITHQISVTKEILNGFFNVYEEKASTKVTGKKSGFTGTVTFLLSTDPRFGGDIKQIINNEGGMNEDDILLFVRSKNGYTLEIITKADSRHDTFIAIMAEERHLIINVDDEKARDNDIFNHNVYGIHIKKENDALSEERPHICIGWSGMKDLSGLNTKDEVNTRHISTYPDATPNSRGQDVGQIHRFKNEAKIGDYVVFAEQTVCHIGRITSEYYYDTANHPNQSEDYVNVRDVEWLKTNIKRSDLSDAFHSSLGAGMSFWGLNDYKSVIYDLLLGEYIKEEPAGDDYILSFDELAEELKRWESEEFIENRTSRLVAFGFKYAESVQLIKGCSHKLINAIGFDNMGTYIDRGKDLYFIIKNRMLDVPLCHNHNETNSCINKDFDYTTTKSTAINKIFYGTPGCGKSYHIQHNILEKENYAPENVIRTTFYQDYSNTDFVGQILPKIEKDEKSGKETVKYIFNPGPFTLALIRAISNPTEKVALVVEEINRGNAPAIFGDIFQLLDRDDNSISEYGITNVGVLDYLNSFEFDVEGEKKRYTFGEIKIPGNMDIFATMNTSDQNVYTLDTAFTRRWSKERMPNDFNGNEIKDMLVPGMYKYTWEEFVGSVNKQIQDKLDDLQVNEDKQVGAFFVKKADLLPKDASSDDKEKAKSFAYKVLEYLWDDVSKLDHTVIFNPSYKTFESLVEAYLKNGVTVFNREIFKEKTEDSTLESSLEE
jgi:hypothetical protein